MAARATSGAKTTASTKKTTAPAKATTTSAKAPTPRKAVAPAKAAVPAQTPPPAPQGPAGGQGQSTTPPVAPVITRPMTNFERAAKDAPTPQAKAYWQARAAEQKSITLTPVPDTGTEPQGDAPAE